jgi:hypothetical protein
MQYRRNVNVIKMKKKPSRSSSWGGGGGGGGGGQMDGRQYATSIVQWVSSKFKCQNMCFRNFKLRILELQVVIILIGIN